jgi:hypothetical protein
VRALHLYMRIVIAKPVSTLGPGPMGGLAG